MSNVHNSPLSGENEQDVKKGCSLNFKVSPELKKEFKVYAAAQGMSMIDLLKEGFALSKAKERRK